MSLLIKEKFSFASANGTNTVRGVVIRRQEPPYKAIVQISHGMTEHRERYEEFMNFLAENGYVAVAHDHIGHKNSVDSNEDLGFFASKDGYKCILSDLAATAGRTRKSFPQLKLFLLGHSMGSFYARAFAAEYPYLADGVIISGTGGKNPLAKPALAILAVLIKFKGERHRSKFFAKLAFGNYLSRIENPKTSRDWLTRDEAVIEKYGKDEFCRFIFTVTGYRDLVTIIEQSNSKKCFENTKKNIPYYIFSGDMDPVGNWGKGVTEVYNNYKSNGVEDVTLKLYEGGRHEMLNEINKSEVYTDILNWLESKI